MDEATREQPEAENAATELVLPMAVATERLASPERLPLLARREIGQPVTDLASMTPGPVIDRNALLARIAIGLVAMLEAYSAGGFAPLRAAWQRRHALQKKTVQVLLPDGGRVRGEVHGVDADGALVVDSGGRRLRFVSGEVSLRRS